MIYKRNVKGIASLMAVNLLLSSVITSYASETNCSYSAIGECISQNDLEKDSVDETAHEDGKYIVFIDQDKQDLINEVSELDCVEEILEENDSVNVFVADLTSEEADLLDSLDENIILEEDIELLGLGNRVKHQKVFGKNNKSKKSKVRELDNEIENEWNIQMIGADEVEKDLVGNEKIKIAVLDSGIDMLTEINVVKSINLVDTEQELPLYMNDMTGHGTAIGSVINQINPQAEIYSVRILDSENRATLSDVIEAIYWCIEQDVDIINMSFGTAKNSEVLERAIQDASAAGILLVAAAGNGGSTEGVEYPAAYEEVMAVGAVNTSAVKTEESAVGEQLDVVAPGEQIKVESMLGLQTIVSGTSMAVPHVVGVASILWQKDKNKSSDFIKKIVQQTSKSLGSDDEYGYGLVDLEYALECYDDIESVYVEDQVENVTIEENKSEISTYEEVTYVEGKWEGALHKDMISSEVADYELTATEIKLLKAGAVYPDKQISGMQKTEIHPEWHGYYTQNYVANYIFATTIAYNAGATSKLKIAKGQSQECYNRMKNVISKTKINNKSWADIISDETKLDYASQSTAVKKQWRKAFLYGMSIHALTDTFAHSAYTKEKDGSIIELTHARGADNPEIYKNRAKCARASTNFGLFNYAYDIVGEVVDFAVDDSYLTGFYLRGITNYSIAANDGKYWTTKEIREWFADINF